MRKLKIACLGPSGSFSEQTLKESLKHQPMDIYFVKDLRDLFVELEQYRVDFIWLPWWNSGCGFLQDSQHQEFLLTIAEAKSDYSIAADNLTALKFSLLGTAGTQLENIKTIYVNPYTQCLCKKFFCDYPYLNIIVKNSSSEAAKEIAATKDPSIAASANLQSAKLYGLEVLQDSMLAPEEQAMMQFILLTHRDRMIDLSLDHPQHITNCIVRSENIQQLLDNTQLPLQIHRASHLDPQVYLLDIRGTIEEKPLQKILDKHLVRYLGSYPSMSSKILPYSL